MRRFAPQLFAQVFCISLVGFCICDAEAQISRLTTQQQIQNREWALENLRRQARLQPKASDKRVDQLALKNDFRQLQVTNNNLMAGVFEKSVNQRISNKEIRSSLGELKKLAERLRSTLALPKVEPKNDTDLALTAGLEQLDQAVMSFVDNPLFKQPRVYDAEMALRAAGDLTEISRLAEALKKIAKD